jgi:DNA-binding IscR family transcriptional regulator
LNSSGLEYSVDLCRMDAFLVELFTAAAPCESNRMLGCDVICRLLLTCIASCNTISYMKRDSRLSGLLHVLLHMAEKNSPLTSEILAKAMGTNPVVIRRIMAGLRTKGYVRSEKGHGGGWRLSCDLSRVTLRDVYLAIGSPSLLAIGNRTESPGCLVEQAVNAALEQAFQDAESLLLSRLGEVTLSVLSADVQKRVVARGEPCNTKDNSHE